MLAKYYDSMLKTPSDIFDTMKFLEELTAPPPRGSTQTSVSDYRVESDSTGLSLSIDLPGVKISDLSVSSIGRDVKVKGTLRGKEFSHTYRIAKEFNSEASTAILEDGVLTLRFGRTPETIAREIKVKSGNS